MNKKFLQQVANGNRATSLLNDSSDWRELKPMHLQINMWIKNKLVYVNETVNFKQLFWRTEWRKARVKDMKILKDSIQHFSSHPKTYPNRRQDLPGGRIYFLENTKQNWKPGVMVLPYVKNTGLGQGLHTDMSIEYWMPSTLSTSQVPLVPSMIPWKNKKPLRKLDMVIFRGFPKQND